MKQSYAHTSTTGGNGITITSARFGGFILNGSAGASTLTIKDGTQTLLVTSAGANVLITEVLPTPIAFRDGAVITCSGTGFYSILYAPNP